MDNQRIIPSDPENSSPRRADRAADLRDWDAGRIQAAAEREGITMTDEHWEVIALLRRVYLEQGLPDTAREMNEALDVVFADRGGRRYLHQLFPGGPINQGSRIAGLPVPSYAEYAAFGTAF